MAKTTYLIDAAHNPSYIDCGQIFSFSKERILSENGYLGCINQRDFPDVISKVLNSERIDPIDLIEYGLIEIL